MNRFKRFLYYWPEAWLDLLDAFVWIITLAQFRPSFGTRYMFFMTKIELKRRVQEIKEKAVH